MAPPPWATEEQCIWLEARMPRYVQGQWFDNFPEEAAIGLPPPSTLGDVPVLTEAQMGQLGKAIKKRKSQLDNWFRNQMSKQRRAAPAKTQSGESIANLLFKHKKTRAHRAIELYQMHNKTKIDEALELAGNWRRRAEEGRRARLEEAQGEEDEEESMPKSYLQSIDELADVYSKVHQATLKKAGWATITIAGGPNPRFNGELSMKVICAGVTAAGNNFEDAHPDFEKSVSLPFQQFLRRLFPPDVRRARALDSEEAAESDGEEPVAEKSKKAKRKKLKKSKSKATETPAGDADGALDMLPTGNALPAGNALPSGNARPSGDAQLSGDELLPAADGSPLTLNAAALLLPTAPTHVVPNLAASGGSDPPAFTPFTPTINEAELLRLIALDEQDRMGDDTFVSDGMGLDLVEPSWAQQFDPVMLPLPPSLSPASSGAQSPYTAWGQAAPNSDQHQEASPSKGQSARPSELFKAFSFNPSPPSSAPPSVEPGSAARAGFGYPASSTAGLFTVGSQPPARVSGLYTSTSSSTTGFSLDYAPPSAASSASASTPITTAADSLMLVRASAANAPAASRHSPGLSILGKQGRDIILAVLADGRPATTGAAPTRVATAGAAPAAAAAGTAPATAGAGAAPATAAATAASAAPAGAGVATATGAVPAGAGVATAAGADIVNMHGKELLGGNIAVEKEIKRVVRELGEEGIRSVHAHLSKPVHRLELTEIGGIGGSVGGKVADEEGQGARYPGSDARGAVASHFVGEGGESHEIITCVNNIYFRTSHQCRAHHQKPRYAPNDAAAERWSAGMRQIPNGKLPKLIYQVQFLTRGFNISRSRAVRRPIDASDHHIRLRGQRAGRRRRGRRGREERVVQLAHRRGRRVGLVPLGGTKEEEGAEVGLLAVVLPLAWGAGAASAEAETACRTRRVGREEEKRGGREWVALGGRDVACSEVVNIQRVGHAAEKDEVRGRRQRTSSESEVGSKNITHMQYCRRRRMQWHSGRIRSVEWLYYGTQTQL
ncbi:hypothetical protein C8J57DRAFT_1230160 [Mycena rebaudengoi]|nr:hypothetical protein C8J57DRAFT_1230160 [Mycena rebaudengoi]